MGRCRDRGDGGAIGERISEIFDDRGTEEGWLERLEKRRVERKVGIRDEEEQGESGRLK